MNAISKVTGVITFPARTAIGAANAGVRTTARVLGWAADRAVGTAEENKENKGTPWPSEPLVSVPVVDPMRATRTPPRRAPARKAPVRKAPAKKVPASQVPLKSEPTPSMPAALRSVDVVDEVPEPAPQAPAKKAASQKPAAKKTVAKKAPAKKKTAAKKAPSKKAAVLAPALGLSEAEVVETPRGRTSGGGKG